MSDCTIGFSAKLNGKLGFISAAHCPNSVSYWGATSASGSALGTATKYSTSNRKFADISFYQLSTNTPVPYFWGTSNAELMRADTVQSAYVGQRLCHRGQTSGFSCGTVESITYTPTWDSTAYVNQSCSNTFISVYGGSSLSGDSGGPWFSGRHPVGIHKAGGASSLVLSKLSYSPATVMVQP